MNEELYPKVEFEEKVRENIFRERTNEIGMRRYKADEKLKHLEKVKKRWTTSNSILKYTGFTVMLVSGVTATALASLATAGFAIPAIVVLSVSGLGLVNSSVFEILVSSLTGKKKKEYRERIKSIKSYLDKMYIFFEKARSDGEISNEELEVIRNLSNEFEGSKSTEHQELNLKLFEDKLKELNSLPGVLKNLELSKSLKPSAPSGSRYSLNGFS